MKRLISILIIASIAVAVIFGTSGCSSKNIHLGQASYFSTEAASGSVAKSSSEKSSSESSGKTSSKKSGSSSESDSSESDENTVELFVTTASIAFDDDNVIKSLKLDRYELEVEVDKKGNIVGDVSTSGVVSNKDKKEAYGMKAASKLGLEFYQQVENLEKWAVGKTVDELLAMKTTDVSASRVCVPAEPDLNVSVSISVGDFLKAIRAAAINAGWDAATGTVSSSEEEEKEIDYSSFFESSAETVQLSSSSSK